jgi:DNA ligase-1
VQIRRDKSPEQIDSVARVEEIYHAQPDKPVQA